MRGSPLLGAMSDTFFLTPSRIIEAYYDELQRFTRRRLRGAPAAEDLVQEACLRFTRLETAKLTNPRAFLYRILSNLVVDHQRQQQRERAVPIESEADIVDETADAERAIISRERLLLLKQAVEELPPRCRECFVLRRFDDLSQEEIAQRMGISRNMVEKHLRTAALHCMKRLSENG